MIYGYIRVSSKEQNVDRQVQQFNNIYTDKLYIEKQSGKDFKSRKVYQALRKKLSSGDKLIIVSVDRLGRNYKEILDEWRYLTERKECNIEVLDMPILNTQSNISGLDGRFISNLILMIQAYTSEKEREKIKERQAQGIKIAKDKGVHLGRPTAVLPDNANEIISDYLNGKYTFTQAYTLMGVSRGTFARLLRNDEKRMSWKKHLYKAYLKNGNIIEATSIRKLSKLLFVSNSTVSNFLKGKITLLNDIVDSIVTIDF